ncbi:four helix bundle protein [bacterium]|nr:four helix bundle protein [bacterium]
MSRFRDGDILERSFNFAVKVLELIRNLPKNQSGYLISNQLGRSSTSVGANLEEADAAVSKKEFVKFVNIAKRESKESNYWLRLIAATNLENSGLLKDLLHESEEITKILFAIVKKSQN